MAYHWRISGNFVFRDTGEEPIREAIGIGEQVTGLRCLGRRFQELRHVDEAVPTEAPGNGIQARTGGVPAHPFGLARYPKKTLAMS